MSFVEPGKENNRVTEDTSCQAHELRNEAIEELIPIG